MLDDRKLRGMERDQAYFDHGRSERNENKAIGPAALGHPMPAINRLPPETVFPDRDNWFATRML